MSEDVFTPAQLAQLTEAIRKAVREELADAGLRIDGSVQQDAAKEDFRFLRKLRTSWDGAVNRVGNAVLIAVIAIGGTIVTLGFWAWFNGGRQ